MYYFVSGPQNFARTIAAMKLAYMVTPNLYCVFFILYSHIMIPHILLTTPLEKYAEPKMCE